MTYLKLQIVRFVDDSFPGFLAGEFIDAQGICHTIIDKVPVIATFRDLWWDSEYPQPGFAQCQVLERSDGDGNSLVRITIGRPVGMETTTGETEFVVRASDLTDEEPKWNNGAPQK